MIDTDHILIGHVTGSYQIDQIFSEVIIFSTSVRASRGLLRIMKSRYVLRELGVERLISVRSTHCAGLVSRRPRAEAFVRRKERRQRKSLHALTADTTLYGWSQRQHTSRKHQRGR